MRLTRTHRSGSAGYTLLELLLVSVIIGLLAAVAVPSWLNFLAMRRVVVANDYAFRQLGRAKSEASRTKDVWVVALRETDAGVEVAIYPDTPDTADAAGREQWQQFPGVWLNDSQTTFRPVPDPETGTRRVMEFDWTGVANGQLGRATFQSQPNGGWQRCTIVSTLIGTTRQGVPGKLQGRLTCLSRR